MFKTDTPLPRSTVRMAQLLCALAAGLLLSLAPAGHAAQAAATTAQGATTTAPGAAVSDPVYLYRSPITNAFFDANGASYDTLLIRWREYLKRFGKSFQQVTRANLLEGLKPGVLVLGSAVLLDDQERAAITAFSDAGGSLMLTWGTGARDGKGRWAGYGFLENLLDMRISGGVTRANEDWFLNTYGDSPISWELPAGKRIFLGKTAETPLRISSPRLAGRYLDWGRHLANETATGAIAYRETGRSRIVYFGFAESSWEFHSFDELSMLFDGAFAWLRHEPRLFQSAWPRGQVAAHLLEMDTEDKFRNAENFARDLQAINAAGTFYSLTSIADDYKDLVKALAEKHEIAYHGDVHVGFRGKTVEEQERRVKNMLAQMRTIVGNDGLARITGFRAPTESFDATTVQVLRRNGILHNVTDPESSESRLPFFSTAEPDVSTELAVISLPRTQADDLNYKASRTPIDKIAAQMARELDSVIEMGALGVLSVHSQNYGADGLMTQLVPGYLKRLNERRSEIWVARGDEITAWWRARRRISVKPSTAPGKSLEFSVAAPGGVIGASFFVTHPAADVMPKTVLPTIAGLPLPHVRKIDAFRSALVFERLDAGNYAYEVKF